MKTLKQCSKKLSQYIFESVGDVRGYPDLDLITIENVKEWLTQKRQEKRIAQSIATKGTWEMLDYKILVIDELLEELQK